MNTATERYSPEMIALQRGLFPNRRLETETDLTIARMGSMGRVVIGRAERRRSARPSHRRGRHTWQGVRVR